MQCQRVHVEIAVIFRRSSKLKEVIQVDTKMFDVIVEIFCHQAISKDIVTRRNGSMGGKHSARGDEFQRTGEIKAIGHQFTTPFKYQERSMTFIDVVDGWLKPQCTYRTHTTDTQHNFLLNAGGSIAAIPTMGPTSANRARCWPSWASIRR